MKQSGLHVLSSGAPAALGAARGHRILLAGETVFASLEATPPEGFIPLPPRESGGGILAAVRRRKGQMVHVFVDERVLSVRGRFALAIDGYLAWGSRESAKGELVLFGGATGETGTNVEVLTFSKGRALHVTERQLPDPAENYYRDAVTGMLQEIRLRHPTARLVQAAPLQNWGIEGVEYVGDKPLRGLAFRPLAAGSTPRSMYLVPAAIAATGFGIYAISIGLGWAAYSAAVEEYEQIAADPAIRAHGGIDSNYLAILNARRTYMEQPRRQEALTAKAAAILGAIASLDNVQVLEMRLPAANANAPAPTTSPGTGHPPDVALTVSVPRHGEPAVTQGKALLRALGPATGLELWLIHQGWRDQGERRVYRFEGFL